MCGVIAGDLSFSSPHLFRLASIAYLHVLVANAGVKYFVLFDNDSGDAYPDLWIAPTHHNRYRAMVQSVDNMGQPVGRPNRFDADADQNLPCFHHKVAGQGLLFPSGMVDRGVLVLIINDGKLFCALPDRQDPDCDAIAVPSQCFFIAFPSYEPPKPAGKARLCWMGEHHVLHWASALHAFLSGLH